MQTKKHRFITVIIILTLIFLTGLVSFVLLFTGPRVRLVNLSFSPEDDIYTYNESASLKFDRPIEQKDYTDSIKISPEIDFELFTSPQQIEIIFKQNLKSDTKYKISMLPKSVKSLNGRVMSSGFNHQFSMGTAEFAYLDRDKGREDNTGATETSFYDATEKDNFDDAIKIGTLNGEEETVYTARTVRSFVASKDYIYVAKYDSDKDEDVIVAVDRSDNEATEYSIVNEAILSGVPFIPENSRIKKMAIAPNSKLLFFTLGVPSERLAKNTKLYDEQDALYSLDPATGEVGDFFIDKTYSERVKATDLHISDDGQALLTSEYDQSYGITSPFERIGTHEPLGTYDFSAGFNYNGSNILFYNKENLVLYDAIETKEKLLEIDQLVTTGKQFSNSNNVTAQAITTSVGGSNYTLLDYDIDSKKSKNIWVEEESIITDFSNSIDDELLAIEIRGYECIYIELEYNGQCSNVQTKIFSRSNSEIIKKVNGFDLFWLP